MKRAIVTGVSGQDGSYMAELLLSKGYAVLGTSRNIATALPGRLDGAIDRRSWDLRDETVLRAMITEFRPDEIYNFAAFSSGARMFEHPVEMGEINGIAVTKMLAAIVDSRQAVRFCQASSSEVFGDALESPQTESTPPNPRTPYGAAKLYADSTLRVFRRTHGVFACSALLFNHESPRRGPGFVTSKVATAAAMISLGRQSDLTLGGLNSRRDWGDARDYVRAMWMMLQHDTADDYVIATGETHSIADLCECAFSSRGLRYQDYVVIDVAAARSSESKQLAGDASKARKVLGWKPETSFPKLVEEMVMSAFAHGFRTL